MEANRSRDVWGQLGRTPSPIRYGYKAQWGYYTDVESGILFLTHRYLDPATGRFLTRDPIGMEGGVNLYQYMGNGVVNKVDPDGLMISLPWPMELPCYHLPDGTCIGFCLFDPKCNPPKPGPKPKPAPKPSPLPPDWTCYRNPRPSDLPPGCFMVGTIRICAPVDCFNNFHPRLGPAMKALCKKCCGMGKLFGWSKHDVNKCNIWCDTP